MVHVIDTRQLGREKIIAVTALETDDGLALFDTGAESTFAHVSAELARLGFALADVRHVFLSHIHFDHAGAAWRFAEAGATVYVHPRGAKHLLDPTRLVESATRLFGAEMERLWGRVAPLPNERLRVLEDGARVQVGRTEVRAHATPGHATHHHVYAWEDHLFGGDVAGVCIAGGPPIPPFVPPELQVEDWLHSIDKMRALGAAQLYLPHFGRVAGPLEAHFAALEERVRRWASWFCDELRAGRANEQLVPAFADYQAQDMRASGANEQHLLDYELADPSFMAVPAARRYWEKFHPQEIA